MADPPLFFTGEVAAKPTEGARQRPCPSTPSTMLRMVPLPRFAREDVAMQCPERGGSKVGVAGFATPLSQRAAEELATPDETGRLTEGRKVALVRRDLERVAAA